MAQAETTFRQGLAVAEEALGRRDELTVSFLNWLGINLRAQQRPSDALTYFSQALEATPSEAPQAAARAGIAINRAGVLESLGRPQEAALDYRFAADLLDGLEARQQTHLQEALQGLVRALGTGKTDDEGKKVAFEVKVGDRVLVSKYGGTEIKIDGKEYKIFGADDLIAVVV